MNINPLIPNIERLLLNNTAGLHVILRSTVNFEYSLNNWKSMRTKIKQLALSCLLIMCFPFFINAQMGNAGRETSMIEETYTGKWKFEAPDAPEGSTKGDIEIKPDRVIMTFDETIDFPSNWIKFRNDSIIYQTVFEAATVIFSLKIINKNMMTGKAVWEDGETEFFLTKNLGVKL